MSNQPAEHAVTDPHVSMDPSSPGETATGACPNPMAVARFLSGGSSPEERECIESHLQRCGACRCYVEQVRSGRSPSVILSPPTDPEVETETETSTANETAPVERVEDFSQTAKPDEATSMFDVAKHGVEIEGYQILGEIHRGGQAVVYQAIQRSTKRRVAIKVMHEGPFAGPNDRARFEREVEILGQLNHPSIVSIHDSGTAQGSFYFVMDYVSGRPLDDWVVTARPTVEQIIELFVKVCDAINAAHLRGIIHRDLKPSNILVDGDGNPHVLDFGLAKITAASVTAGDEPRVVTVTGQFFGSLPWASPEQAEAVPSKIDVRTDVYSLGVILYQMLTGRFPYEVIGNMRDVLDNILRAEPARPSTIRRQINNEIETIVLKALSKERERRYQSAGELGRDIRHYLSGEPIEAKRDSGWYVLRKTVSRHKLTVGIVAGFAVLIVVFAAVLSHMATRLQARAEHIDRSRAEQLAAAFVNRPAAAAVDLAQAAPRVRAMVSVQTKGNVDSPVYTKRIAGARGALWSNPDAFWASVDGGALWQHGEWLELASMDLPSEIVAQLKAKAVGGTNQEKYVSFCLIGQTRPPDPSLAGVCVDAAKTESDPGVRLAAWWAARMRGRDLPLIEAPDLRVHMPTGLSFVRIPGCKSFRRGSPANEEGRYENEVRPEAGVAIAPFFLSTTEVTMRAFRGFLADPEMLAWLKETTGDSKHRGELLQKDLERWQEKIKADRLDEAVGYASLAIARKYCAWLTDAVGPSFDGCRFRLPTEDEWEYACRAGNDGRFCFGDDVRYARYFANCNGYESRHVVARRMPNAHGVFDMHGGLWELCDSRFPAKFADASVPEDRRDALYVVRGGAYYSPAIRCRSAQRNYCDATTQTHYWGFRVVMEARQP